MKLIPTYTWNKAIVNLGLQREKIYKLPWLQGAILLACVVVAMLLANLLSVRISSIILMLTAGLISLIIFLVKKPAAKGGAGK